LTAVNINTLDSLDRQIAQVLIILLISIIVLLYYVIIYIKKTLRCDVTKTVLDKEKIAAAERIFRKIFKKENNAADTEKSTEAFKLTHY